MSGLPSSSAEPALPGGEALAWRREALVAAALGLLAALVTFRRVLLSGFTEVPGDAYDGRLNAFFLEHSWGWLAGRPLDCSLWGLPIFFPHGGNALAYSDPMVSFGPFYWPWRALGLAPDTSYQLWCMAVVAASASAGYLFLRLAVRLSLPAAALGAWLASCSASRLHQISHTQLLPVLYVFAGLGGVVAWARLEVAWQRRAAAALAAAALVAQLYGGFYQGFFLAVAVAVLAALALALPATRVEVVRRLRADWLTLPVLGAGTALALWPWAEHYRAAQAVVGARNWEAIVSMVPRPATWFYMAPGALAYRWTRSAAVFRQLPWDFEHAVGLGLLTTTAALVAAVACRRRPAVWLVGGVTVLLVGATTMVDGHSFWQRLVDALPALGAARAICRVGLLLPIGAAVVLGTWADAARGRARAVALAVLVACGVEQISEVETHDRDVQRRWVAELTRRVDRTAPAFVVSRSSDKGGAMLIHLDAMFAAAATGVPTVNGASGSEPPGWEGLQWARVRNETAARLFQQALSTWVRSGGVDPATVQWIQLPAKYRGAPPAPRRSRPRPEG